MSYRSSTSRHGLSVGVALATFASGPTFLAMLALAAWQSSPRAIALGADPGLLMVLPLAGLSIVVGGVIALLPVTLAGVVMAWAAQHNAGLRHPAAWGLAGGLIAGGWMPFVTTADDAATFAMTATGVVCALICRSRVTWVD